jgi:hypothetical protein
LLWITSTFALSGCISPIALNRAVGAYDEAIVSAASKQLLTNIARAHQRQPIHFTGVSNIAATFVLRLMAQEVRIRGSVPETTYRNAPSDSTGYEMFRRLVLHLSAIQDQNRLYAEPLTLERTWTVPADSVSAEGFQNLEKEFSILYNGQDNTYTLRKQTVGPILITNYDPATLLPGESAQLNEQAGDWIANDLAFDIRARPPFWVSRAAYLVQSARSPGGAP